MLKQQLSPRSVHPYQTTVVPRSDKQLATANQQRAKYPWTEDGNTPVYQLTGVESSSTSENPYHVPHSQYYQTAQCEYGAPSPVYQMPYTTGPWRNHKKNNLIAKPLPSNTYSFPPSASAFSLPLCEVDHSRVSHSPVPTVPSLSPEVPIIGACGGHCPGFEYVCYYILQVIFVVGILTGISLCIAGIVLRRTNRNGDLGVLVYIGSLSSCVCGVLLGVQCCVRREIRQRKLRANLHIPMQSIQEAPVTACPLLPSTLHSQMYRPPIANVCTEEEVTGIPWWRREIRD